MPGFVSSQLFWFCYGFATYDIAHAGVRLVILQESWDYRYVLPCLTWQQLFTLQSQDTPQVH